MVARQLKVLSQVDAFTFPATRNIEHVFKKFVCLTVFVKDFFYIYLNNIYHRHCLFIILGLLIFR